MNRVHPLNSKRVSMVQPCDVSITDRRRCSPTYVLAMGMKTMFYNLADFSGTTLVPLKIDKTIQKAFIEVNEEGSEAAVATGVGMRSRRMVVQPETFQVDRPFMFVTKHKPSNIPMFADSIKNLQMLYSRDEL